EGRLRYAISGIGHDQPDATACIERTFDFNLTVLDVRVEPVEGLLQKQADAATEGLRILLLELLGLLEFGLHKVERFRRSMVVNCIQPLVVEIVNHGSSGRLWCDV